MRTGVDVNSIVCRQRFSHLRAAACGVESGVEFPTANGHQSSIRAQAAGA
jgi:hypothetical protein